METLLQVVEGEVLEISGDDLRKYHPEYARLQREDPMNAAFYTDRDSGRWAEMLIEMASDAAVNLVIESTMRVPDTFRRTSWALVMDMMRSRGAAAGDMAAVQAEADRAVSSLN